MRKNGHEMDTLSPQQAAVLALIWEGLAVKEIAREMGLSHKTIKNYLANMYDKFEVTDRVSMVRRALEMGLLHVNGPQWMRHNMEVPG